MSGYEILGYAVVYAFGYTFGTAFFAGLLLLVDDFDKQLFPWLMWLGGCIAFVVSVLINVCGV